MSTPAELLTNALHQSLAHTLENLVFEEALRVDDPGSLDGMTAPHWFRVEVLDPVPGAIAVICEDGLLAALAALLFGPEGSREIDLQRDAGRELSNTIAGHLMAHLVADEPFSLGIPSDGPGVIPKAETAQARLTCLVEGRSIMVLAWGPGLVVYASDLPDESPQSASGGWAAGDPEAWGTAPPADPQTGRWPAGGNWGEQS